MLRYLLGVFMWWAPLVGASCVVKGAPLWMAFPILGAIMGIALLAFLLVLVLRRYGGNLGRKLTRPL